MNLHRAMLVILTLVLAVISVNTGLAAPLSQPQPQETAPVSPAALLPITTSIPVQGRLTDASGVPLNGDYKMVFTLYPESTGSTYFCRDVHETGTAVHVENGLFNATINDCGTVFTGPMVYLGIQVGSDPEMTPRQPIYPVPYAATLVPGAKIMSVGSTKALELVGAGVGLSNSALLVSNANANGIALWSYASSTDSTFVTSNNGPGPLIKAFGSDGGEDEFRVENNGTIFSHADSYVSISLLDMGLGEFSAGKANIVRGTYGYVTVYPTTTGSIDLLVGVTLPIVLYGQPVDVEELRVCYATSNATTSITSTDLIAYTDLGSVSYYAYNYGNQASTARTCYAATPSPSYFIDPDDGTLTLRLTINVANTAHYVTFYGARLRLGHTPVD